MKNTTENNKLIAEFMQPSFNGFGTYDFGGCLLNLEDLQFHKDWNWLMEVVEKIEGINNSDFVIEYTSVMMPNVFGTKQFIAKTKIEATYNAVVEFIKWYNQQQINQAIQDSIDVDEWSK